MAWRTDTHDACAHPVEVKNQLIEGLGPKARNSLLALGESVPLALSEVLGEAGGPMRHVYFPVDGFVSLVAVV
ncbi:Crp/Fnr family transcriptional regulator, partial [Klebsiella pneumoniae]|uniref:hypothetical protein n=1 Tax=Klebsiella pneumoniae TaxID=573 RepID=UPI00210CD049